MSQKLKLFICYSHADEDRVKDFRRHISPLVSRGVLELWSDKDVLGGEPFQEVIDKNLSSADIVCLFISANFLSSTACMDEKERALRLKETKGTRVIPIILSPCMWTEMSDISGLLVLPTDAKPISSFSDENIGWVDTIELINKVCLEIKTIQSLKLTPEFEGFLNSAELLTKSHSRKEELALSDILVFPHLKKYDEIGDTKRYDSKNFEKDVLRFGKIIIEGESQSGKTTMAKLLFNILKNLKFIPVYVADDNSYLGNPHTKITKAFSGQYQGISFEDIDQSRVVPILDNFHFAKDKNKYIEAYQGIKHQILIVDDIFSLSIRNETLIKGYHRFKILQFSPNLRDTLIENWVRIKENDSIEVNPNHLYQSIDEKTEIIENILGKVFGKGIMPAYPFFILSILAAHETQKPLDQEITSQGYCYQALIFLFLKKQGVKNEHIDIYTNFLTELSHYIYTRQSNGLSNVELDDFYRNYRSKFNLPLETKEVMKTLVKVNICYYDSFNNFSFSYKYIYYFFVAKKLAENIDKNKAIIDKILSNLHKDENAYIAVFISHHSKSNYLLDELLLNAEILFERYVPATLNSDELMFFDKHEDKIIKAVLPDKANNPIEKRQKILSQKAIQESSQDALVNQDNDFDEESDTFSFTVELRRSIKTVEVMGMIIKNRSGSLELYRLEYIFKQAMNVHLRILTFFFDLIKEENIEEFFVEFIKERLDHIIGEKEKKPSKEKLESIARSIFWNLNFGVIHGCITKIIQSLGSVNLLKVANSVCANENTPSTYIVNQGILMWYAKNLKIDEIYNRIEKDGFSKTAKKLMVHKIIEHITLHPVNMSDVNKVGQKFGIAKKFLLAENAKNK